MARGTTMAALVAVAVVLMVVGVQAQTTTLAAVSSGTLCASGLFNFTPPVQGGLAVAAGNRAGRTTRA